MLWYLGDIKTCSGQIRYGLVYTCPFLAALQLWVFVLTYNPVMFQMMVPNNRSEGARLNEKNLLMESKSSTFFFNLWTRCLMVIFVITLKICRCLESGNTHGSACLNFVFHNSWIREGLEMKLWRLEVDDKPKGAGDMKPFHREVHKEGCRHYQWPRANVIEWEHSDAEGMLNSFVNHLYLIHNSRAWSFHRRISPVT